MLKYCLKKWDENKGVLEQELRTNPTLNDCAYIDLVKLVVKYILNSNVKPYSEALWDIEHITEIDNGNYQGTLLFLIPQDTYQPAEHEYLMTFVAYGSCSGCDTLQAIQGWGDKLLTEYQVKDFMQLCKDLITNMIKPYNRGWRSEEEFTHVEGEGERE